jgi:hypothetical protein
VLLLIGVFLIESVDKTGTRVPYIPYAIGLCDLINISTPMLIGDYYYYYYPYGGNILIRLTSPMAYRL